MTGSDDGGFSPHPGDPWAPGWSDDSDQSEDVVPTEGDSASDSSDPMEPMEPGARQKKRGRRAKRRRKDRADAAMDPDPGFDPTRTAFDVADALPPISGEVGRAEDPFGALLEREGRVAPKAESPPPPAWTVDEEPSSEQALTIEQPSWAGQATAAAAGVEAVGFDEVLAESSPVAEERVASPAGFDDQVAGSKPEVASVEESAAPDEAVVVESDMAVVEESPVTDRLFAESPGIPEPPQDQTEPLADGLGTAPDSDARIPEAAVFDGEEETAVVSAGAPPDVGDPAPELIGEYGVAGPEAFEVLGADDAATDEMGDWGAFMTGSGPPAVGDVEVSPEPTVSEDVPVKRRRFWRRKEVGAEIVEDGFVDAAAEARADSPPVDQDDTLRTDEVIDEVAGFDEWTESERPVKRRRFGRRRGPGEVSDAVVDQSGDWPEIESHASAAASRIDEVEGVSADVGENLEEVAVDAGGDLASIEDEAVDLDAVAEALQLLREAAPPPPMAPPPGHLVVGEVPTSTESAEVATGESTASQPALFGESTPYEAVTEPVERTGDDGDGLGVVDEQAEWVGDSTAIPDGWFAEVDEDEVVPPSVAETPETEWPDVGDQGGHEDPAVPVGTEQVDLFDIDYPVVGSTTAPSEPSLQPGLVDSLPEGYEAWSDAVAGAVGASASAGPPDDATYEYELPAGVESAPEAAELPAGFERFPSELEPFELPEASLRAEMATNEFEAGWVTDEVDAGNMFGEEIVGATGEIADVDLGESVYAGSATIEHRDLAAAVAQAAAEDTEWQAVSAAMPGMGTGVVGFDDVADLGTGEDYVAPTRSDLGIRAATGIVLVALLFGSLFVADVAFAVFLGFMVMLGLTEFYAALRRAGYLPLSLFGLVGAVVTLIAVWFHGPLAIPAGILLTSTVTFFFYAFALTRRDALVNGGLTVLGLGWIVASTAFAISIGRADERIVLVFAIVVVTAATDTGAYAFGRAWGRSPLAPVLSPNKTVEGLAGGVILGLVAAGAIGFFELGPFDLKSGLALGAVIAVLGPLGDLAESLVKRSLGIKDMGGTLPGHGGILDRIDAFLFVIPAAWVLFKVAGFLG